MTCVRTDAWLALLDDRDGVAAWTNWAGDQACVPSSMRLATRVEDVVEAVEDARMRGRRLRPVGSGHSFTGIALTGGVLLDTSRLDGVVAVDRECGLVTVGAGIRLDRLNDELDRRGLALPNLGDIDRQTLAGAVSTATHGTGAALQNVSAQVEAVQLVAGDGNVHEIDGGDLLAAARVGLGALGVMTEVTLRTVPAFLLHRRDEPRDLEDVLAGFDGFAEVDDHFEIFVWPGSETALTVRRNRTDRAPQPRGRVEEYVTETLLQNRVGNVLLRAVRHYPAFVSRLTSVATALLSEGEYVDRSFRVFSSRREVPFTEMEYAVPRSVGVEALRGVLEVAARKEYAVALPVECRVVAADGAWLSPTYERDSVYIAVHQYPGLPWQPYFDAVEELLANYGGRPHWGKRHSLTATDLAARYPRFGDFLAVRDRLDPDRVYRNAYLDRVLGP